MALPAAADRRPRRSSSRSALAIYWRGVLGLPYSLSVAVLGHILLALPFVILTMNAAVSHFRFSLLEAARDLGASPGGVPRHRCSRSSVRRSRARRCCPRPSRSTSSSSRSSWAAARRRCRCSSGAACSARVDPSLNALATTLLVATTFLALLAARRTTVRL